MSAQVSAISPNGSTITISNVPTLAEAAGGRARQSQSQWFTCYARVFLNPLDTDNISGNGNQPLNFYDQLGQVVASASLNFSDIANSTAIQRSYKAKQSRTKFIGATRGIGSVLADATAQPNIQTPYTGYINARYGKIKIAVYDDNKPQSLNIKLENL